MTKRSRDEEGQYNVGNENDKKIVKNLPIHIAAKQGDFEEIQNILKNDPSQVNAVGRNGQTPLHCIAAKLVVAEKDIKCVNLLIDSGADISAKDDDGELPVYIAASGLNSDIMMLILERAKAQLGAIDDRDQTLLQTQVNAIGDYNQTLLHLIAAFSCIDTRVIKWVLNNGGNINARNEDDDLPIHRAAMEANLTAIKAILGGNPSQINSVGANGLTVLQMVITAEYNNNLSKIVETIAFLLENGAELPSSILVASIEEDVVDLIAVAQIADRISKKESLESALFFELAEVKDELTIDETILLNVLVNRVKWNIQNSGLATSECFREFGELIQENYQELPENYLEVVGKSIKYMQLLAVIEESLGANANDAGSPVLVESLGINVIGSDANDVDFL